MHIHKWGNWSEPYPAVHTASYGAESKIVMNQRRCCVKCGRTQQEYLGDPPAVTLDAVGDCEAKKT